MRTHFCKWSNKTAWTEVSKAVLKYIRIKIKPVPTFTIIVRSFVNLMNSVSALSKGGYKY